MALDVSKLIEESPLLVLQTSELILKGADLVLESTALGLEGGELLLQGLELGVGLGQKGVKVANIAVEGLDLDPLVLIRGVNVVEFSLQQVDLVQLFVLFLGELVLHDVLGLAGGATYQLSHEVVVQILGVFESVEDGIVIFLALLHLEELSLELRDDDVLVVAFDLLGREVLRLEGLGTYSLVG